MLLLCGSILLLCLCVNAENIALCREPGENVTLECSLAGCTSSIDSYIGMYLYCDFREQEEVLYYHSGPEYEKISLRPKYENRTQKEGSLKNHTITISNLTVNDSGMYSCDYKKDGGDGIKCNVYVLVVRDLHSPGSSQVPSRSPPTTEKCPPLVLVVISTFAVSMLVTMIFIKMIVPRVKHWISSRRARNAPPVSNDYVHEVMTKNGLRPLATPEQSSPNSYGFD